jgi:hypothetical protein
MTSYLLSRKLITLKRRSQQASPAALCPATRSRPTAPSAATPGIAVDGGKVSTIGASRPLRGSNYPRRRADDMPLPDFATPIET